MHFLNHLEILKVRIFGLAPRPDHACAQKPVCGLLWFLQNTTRDFITPGGFHQQGESATRVEA